MAISEPQHLCPQRLRFAARLSAASMVVFLCSLPPTIAYSAPPSASPTVSSSATSATATATSVSPVSVADLSLDEADDNAESSTGDAGSLANALAWFNRPAVAPADPDLSAADNDAVETALDFYVGGNYYGYVFVTYTDEWVRLIDPQQAIYLLPVVNDRHAMSELFAGRIYGQRTIAGLGTVDIDPVNFTFRVTLAPEQAVRPTLAARSVDGARLEGEPTFLTRLSVRGTFPVNSDASLAANEQRYSAWNHTYFSSGPFRLGTSGIWNSQQEEYDLRTLKGEYELTLSDHPFVFSGGLLDLPGQQVVSSVDVIGVSLTTSDLRYDSQLQQRGSPLEVYVPTRALVEVFRGDSGRGELLFSRVLDSGFQRIDVSMFPRGSYPVEVVISSNGAVLSREVEQFYRFDEILPRERYDINITLGSARNSTDSLSVPVAFGSFRMRLLDFLEGGVSLYVVDDRTFLSESLFGFWQTENGHEWRYDLGVTQSSESALLGASGSLSWRRNQTSAYFSFLRSLAEDPVFADRQRLLTFPRRIQLNASFSHAFEALDRMFYLSFNARRRNGEDRDNDWRYGPRLRFNLWQTRRSTLAMSTAYYRTQDGDEKQVQLSYTWRPEKTPELSLASRLESLQTDQFDTIQWQNSASYYGHQESPGILQNSTVDAIVTRNQRTPESVAGQSDTLSYLGYEHRGQQADVRLFANTNSNRPGAVVGGEIDTTILTGKDSLFHVSRSIPFDNALVAVSVSGDTDSTAEVAILVDEQVRGYTRVGETTLVDVPVFRPSVVSIEQVRTDEELLLIPENKTQVRPYPRNVLHRNFEVMRVMIVAGRLIDYQGDPIVDSFVETGFDPSYTDDGGEFIIEVPVGNKGRDLNFLVRNQTCAFFIDYSDTPNTIRELGDIRCEQASQARIREIRQEHDLSRTIGFKSALRSQE